MLIGTIVVGIIFIIFFPWFSSLHPLSAGDWSYLFFEQVREMPWIPQIQHVWLGPYYQILTKISVQYLGLPWEATERLLWFLPFILICALVSFKAFRSWIAALVYTTNTYILMIVGGGQMGVALAYAMAPYVLTHVSLIPIAVQAMFDPRVAILTVIASLVVRRQSLGKMFFIAFGVLAIHLYWIVPLLRSPEMIRTQLSQASSGMLNFLSFATFSQTISLLHPNWPENLFGKVYFMQPEFLLIPIAAFTVILIGKKEMKRDAVPFALLALIGAFFAKGTQPPFGGISTWVFAYVPGFFLFRDPTKFYILIALAYAYLIPKSIDSMKFPRLVSLLFILIWAITIRQALTGHLNGTFEPAAIDPEYIRLKNLIDSSQGTPTFWVPQVQRFAFVTRKHPATALSADAVTSATVSGIIVVPFDSKREMFLNNYIYDESIRQHMIDQIDAYPGLVRDESFIKLAVWRKP